MDTLNIYPLIFGALLFIAGIVLWRCEAGSDTYEADTDDEKVNLVCHILASQPFRRLYAIVLITAGLTILLLQL